LKKAIISNAITSMMHKARTGLEHFAEMARDEQHHEEKLIEMIDEERLQYMGSVVTIHKSRFQND